METFNRDAGGLSVGIPAAWQIGSTFHRLFCLVPLVFAAWPLAVASREASDKEANVLDRLVSCVGVQEENLRLGCYDSVLQPLAETRVEQNPQFASPLHSFTGSGDHDTDVLTIREPWHLRWALDGSLLTIELRSAEGNLVDMAGNQIGSGHGRSAPLEPGVYRLAFRAIGDWQVILERE